MASIGAARRSTKAKGRKIMKTAMLLESIIAAAAGLALAAPAAAGEQVWQVGADYVIRSHDLDLDRPEGREALLARVDQASDKLCRAGVAKARRECTEQVRARVLASAPLRMRSALVQALGARDEVRLAGWR
jgi:UrcA family protein